MPSGMHMSDTMALASSVQMELCMCRGDSRCRHKLFHEQKASVLRDLLAEEPRKQCAKPYGWMTAQEIATQAAQIRPSSNLGPFSYQRDFMSTNWSDNHQSIY